MGHRWRDLATSCISLQRSQSRLLCIHSSSQQSPGGGEGGSRERPSICLYGMDGSMYPRCTRLGRRCKCACGMDMMRLRSGLDWAQRDGLMTGAGQGRAAGQTARRRFRLRIAPLHLLGTPALQRQARAWPSGSHQHPPPLAGALPRLFWRKRGRGKGSRTLNDGHLCIRPGPGRPRLASLPFSRHPLRYPIVHFGRWAGSPRAGGEGMHRKREGVKETR